MTSYARSADYANIETRYVKSKAHNSSRVYYTVMKSEDIFADYSNNDAEYCVVVIAETDKENEPKVIQRIRGTSIRTVRRGM